jgi:hypothetical protein
VGLSVDLNGLALDLVQIRSCRFWLRFVQLGKQVPSSVMEAHEVITKPAGLADEFCGISLKWGAVGLFVKPADEDANFRSECKPLGGWVAIDFFEIRLHPPAIREKGTDAMW